MANPTDTGGENPTIRDVRPPSDTDPWVVRAPLLNRGTLCWRGGSARDCSS